VRALNRSLASAIRLDASAPDGPVDFYSPLFVTIRIQNGLGFAVDGDGPFPVNIAHFWTDRAGNRAEGPRSPIPRVEANSSKSHLIVAPLPFEEGEYEIEITLVQEERFWFSEAPLNLKIRRAIRVERSCWWTRGVRPYDRQLIERMRARSIERPDDLLDIPPWISRNIWRRIVDHYERTANPRIFEFGLGSSSLQHIRNLHWMGGGEFAGVEHSARWFELVCNALPQLARELHADLAPDQAVSADRWEGSLGRVRLSLARAAVEDLLADAPAYIETLAREFDVVIVDGIARNEAVERVLNGGYVRRGQGLLILHDAGRGTDGYLGASAESSGAGYRASVERLLDLGGEWIDGGNGHRLEACLATPRRLKVGAYALCYQEAELLAANIRWMYDLVDTFHIVIGPSERGVGFERPADVESGGILRAVYDPAGKIRVVAEGSWKDKEEMTEAATRDLTTDVLLHLDADEFWPRETFEMAMREIERGADRVEALHYIFFGDTTHVCAHVREDGTESPFYFAPARLLRVHAGARARHFGPAYVYKTGELVGQRAVRLPRTHPLWHFGWIGKNRIARKIRFYAEGRRMEMPSANEVWEWIEAPRDRIFQLGEHQIRPVSYAGPAIPSHVIKDVLGGCK
jgi:hypothetical protein